MYVSLLQVYIITLRQVPKVTFNNATKVLVAMLPLRVNISMSAVKHKLKGLEVCLQVAMNERASYESGNII